jgi:hypothetical protein
MKSFSAALLALLFSAAAWAQPAEFNPLKEMQTVPNAARITVTVDRLLFSTTRWLAILVDGNRVADGDSDNPATIEAEADKEFVLELCALNRNMEIIKGWCVFGGVMRPADNTLYRFELKNTGRIGGDYLVYLGRQGF